MNEHHIRYRVRLLEDTHVGTGEGRLGIVDDEQTRDRDGNPMVRFTTFQGLLREAALDWLSTLKACGENVDQRWRDVSTLLGSRGNQAGTATLTSLRAEAPDADAFSVWTFTAREVFSRSPRPDMLRTVEFAAAGVCLEGEIRWLADDDSAARQRELLQTALKRIRSVGGGKSRGWGQIQLELLDEASSGEAPPMQGPPQQADGPVLLRLLLHNLEPLNLAATGNPGNVIDSEGYLSGTRLRGSILTWLSQRDADPKLTEQLAESMQVLNGYPLPAAAAAEWKQSRVVPVPLSIRQPKPQPHEATSAPWWSRSHNANQFGGRGERDTLTGLPGEDDERIKGDVYLAGNGSPWTRVQSHRAIHMRNLVPTARVDREGIPEDEAQLFSEEVLVERQWFVAELWFPSRELAGRFASHAALLCDGAVRQRSWLSVGRRRRPVRVEGYEWVDLTRDPGPAIATVPAADQLRLDLTSDWIARAADLTFLTDLPPSELCRLIAQSAARHDIEDSDQLSAEGVECHQSETETRPVYGYNTASGLPRAAAIAVSRGSTLMLKFTDAEQAKRWTRVLTTLADRRCGVGERTAEGFGQFVVNADLAPSQAPSPPTRSEPEVNRQEELMGDVEALLESLGRKKDWPKVNQWQALRQAAATAAAPKEVAPGEPPIGVVLKPFEQHAQIRAGEAWINVLPKIRAAFSNQRPSADDSEQTFQDQRFVLDQLAQAVVFELAKSP